jgi:hypothetical protein
MCDYGKQNGVYYLSTSLLHTVAFAMLLLSRGSMLCVSWAMTLSRDNTRNALYSPKANRNRIFSTFSILLVDSYLLRLYTPDVAISINAEHWQYTLPFQMQLAVIAFVTPLFIC